MLLDVVATADRKPKKESAMNRILDNFAAVLVVVPFVIAAASVLVTVFAGVPV